MNERDAWIALASTEGIGEVIFGTLISAFGSAAQALRAATDGRLDAWFRERRRLDGRPPMPAAALAALRQTAANPTARLDEIAARRLWTLTPLDADFPHRLRDLDPPPAMINGLGDAGALGSARSVAVVGTRRPTVAGRALTTRVATRLVECRATVVSGLAVGIDGAAHSATLQAGGTTVAVIGAGHESPGPRAHARLHDEIVESGGALISEYHPAVLARKGTFPRRNRIIAALGDATVVIEAPRTSGARITARLALELGRQVLIAPGRVGDWSVAGSLALLRESPARPLVGLDEMVEDLGYLEPSEVHAPGDNGTATSAAALLAMLGPTEREIASALRNGPASLDSLVSTTGFSPAVVSSAMTLLLMRGWARPVGPAFTVAGALAR
jgi:DNA processing protein